MIGIFSLLFFSRYYTFLDFMSRYSCFLGKLSLPLKNICSQPVYMCLFSQVILFFSPYHWIGKVWQHVSLSPQFPLSKVCLKICNTRTPGSLSHLKCLHMYVIFWRCITYILKMLSVGKKMLLITKYILYICFPLKCYE